MTKTFAFPLYWLYSEGKLSHPSALITDLQDYAKEGDRVVRTSAGCPTTEDEKMQNAEAIGVFIKTRFGVSIKLREE